MFRTILTASLAAFLAVPAVVAQSSTVPAAVSPASAAPSATETGPIPLVRKKYPYDGVPYQVDTDNGDRGTQSGYNRCNSTTEGPTSQCQTAIFNSADDFCLWGPPQKNGVIGDVEGESVAYCTKPGHGTRVIPPGTITAMTFVRTPDYIQVTGFINQEGVNIKKSDDGGELDPHGSDQRGNPLGGLVYSTAWGGGYKQVIQWHNFMGAGEFCFKACDPAGPNARQFCEHVYDLVGCEYNAPSAWKHDVFESCLGDNQDFVGVYTGADGQTSTWKQLPETAGGPGPIPYKPRVPASSSCTTYQSAELFALTSSVASATMTSGAAAGTGAAGSSASPAAGTKSGASSSFGGVWTAFVGAVGLAIGAVVAL